MGGGKRKYNQKIRFRKFHHKPVEASIEEKKEPPKPENVKALLEMWQSKKKEKQTP